MDRRILHIDLDAFYASVEQRDNPSLRGQPLVVGGSPTARGVVAAASYEARAFGIHSAMPTARAVRLCPSVVIVSPDFARYKTVSSAIFEIFRSITPLVEPLSLDEAYLDVTENAWLEPSATRVAKRVKHQIYEGTGLTASAGVAPNKFLAKVASAWKKPDGLTVIPPARVESFLQQLPVEALWGVGPVTARKLRSRGWEKLVNLRAVPVETLRELVGSQASSLQQLARGIDDRPVVPDRPLKSVGTENTFARDLVDLTSIRAEVTEMAQQVSRWLERKALFAKTVTVKVRYSDFSTITRSQTELPPTRISDLIVARALGLLERTEVGRRPVRLLGVSLHGLTTTAQPASGDASDRLPFE